MNEAILLLIVNNSFILAGAIVKYFADSQCLRFTCCRAVEVEQLTHRNSDAREDADRDIERMSTTGFGAGAVISAPTTLRLSPAPNVIVTSEHK